VEELWLLLVIAELVTAENFMFDV